MILPTTLPAKRTSRLPAAFSEAHETFALLAAYPNIGWPAKLKHP